MGYNIVATKVFSKNLKALFKKYKSIKSDIIVLQKELLKNPQIGIHLGKSVYKIRLAIKSKGKGKSAGARIITYVKVQKETVYLLSIYDKSERENISDLDIKEFIKQIDE